VAGRKKDVGSRGRDVSTVRYVTGSSQVNISAIARLKRSHNSELNGLSDKKRAEIVGNAVFSNIGSEFNTVTCMFSRVSQEVV